MDPVPERDGTVEGNQTPVNEKTGFDCEYKYLLILDFEATCDSATDPTDLSWDGHYQEIIEFPVALIEIQNARCLDEFHEYVRPKYQPKLTPFCTELTGITQEMVDRGKPIQEVLKLFNEWVEKHKLTPKNSIVVTCGHWDLRCMWPKQASNSCLKTPPLFKQWINIKKIFPAKVKPKGMMSMLEMAGIAHEGRHHSGIDDVRNIANVARWLVKKNIELVPSWGNKERQKEYRTASERASKFKRKVNATKLMLERAAPDKEERLLEELRYVRSQQIYFERYAKCFADTALDT